MLHNLYFILYMLATIRFTAFSRHAAQSLFYFPHNAVYFTVLSFSVLNNNHSFFINRALTSEYQPSRSEVNGLYDMIWQATEGMMSGCDPLKKTFLVPGLKYHLY